MVQAQNTERHLDKEVVEGAQRAELACSQVLLKKEKNINLR